MCTLNQQCLFTTPVSVGVVKHARSCIVTRKSTIITDCSVDMIYYRHGHSLQKKNITKIIL